MPTKVKNNLGKLRIDIKDIVNGEENVKVFIYISKITGYVCLQMGKGEKVVIININKDGINYTKTEETFCEKAKALIANAVLSVLSKLLNTLSSMWSLVMDAFFSSASQSLGVCSS